MPDRTFSFSIAALVLCLVALGYLLFWPVLEVTDVVDGVIIYSSVSVLGSANLWAIVISAFPTLIVGASIATLPRSGRWQRNHKVNVAIGTAVMWVFVIMFAQQVGVVYIPAATMMTSVVVLMFVRSRAWGKDDYASDAEAAAAMAVTEVKLKKRRRRSGIGRDVVGRRPRRRKW